jgi:hypothetical protein
MLTRPPKGAYLHSVREVCWSKKCFARNNLRRGLALFSSEILRDSLRFSEFPTSLFFACSQWQQGDEHAQWYNASCTEIEKLWEQSLRISEETSAKLASGSGVRFFQIEVLPVCNALHTGLATWLIPCCNCFIIVYLNSFVNHSIFWWRLSSLPLLTTFAVSNRTTTNNLSRKFSRLGCFCYLRYGAGQLF